MDTRVVFSGVVLAVAALRLLELRHSSRNIKRLKARGAVEVGYQHYPVMVLVHGAWLVACVAEVWLLGRGWIPALGVPMAVVFAAGMFLRHWTIATLGDRWSTRVVYVPGDPLETGGPFRWLRHPNYLGVVLEIAALPLIHTAWITALVFSAANAGVLSRRLAAENAALERRNHDARSGRSGRLPEVGVR